MAYSPKSARLPAVVVPTPIYPLPFYVIFRTSLLFPVSCRICQEISTTSLRNFYDCAAILGFMSNPAGTKCNLQKGAGDADTHRTSQGK